MKTPILFLIFNRPDTTKIVFEEIRKAKPAKLYVAADGPRPGRTGEDSICRETRQIIEQIDWECEVKTLFRNENLGCKKAVSSGINWFFEQEEEGIVLEDDCLPDQSFFSYCTDLLEYYRHDTSVMHIGGTNAQKGKRRGDGSYYFTNYNQVWGWASWRRAWQNYTLDWSTFSEEQMEEVLEGVFKTEKERTYWFNAFKQVKYNQIDTWDYQWTFSIWKNKGKCIVPEVNLISNIGFGQGATHTSGADILGLGNMKRGSVNKMVHPTDKQANQKADLFAFNHYAKPSKMYFMVRKIMYLVNKMFGQ